VHTSLLVIVTKKMIGIIFTDSLLCEGTCCCATAVAVRGGGLGIGIDLFANVIVMGGLLGIDICIGIVCPAFEMTLTGIGVGVAVGVAIEDSGLGAGAGLGPGLGPCVDEGIGIVGIDVAGVVVDPTNNDGGGATFVSDSSTASISLFHCIVFCLGKMSRSPQRCRTW